MAAASTVAFQFQSFRGLPVRHGLSGKDMSAPCQGDTAHSPATDSASIEANRRAFVEAIGLRLQDLTVARQVHGSIVRVVTREDRGRGLYPRFDGFSGTDGLLTNDPHVAIGVIVADCVPLVLYDPVRHALAVVHAGWRGTVQTIANEAIVQMAAAFGTRASDVIAGIGPSIGPCCYEVGRDVIDAWSATTGGWGAEVIRQDGSAYHFDLWTANRLTLVKAGVSPEHIEVSGVCVKCESKRYFSYRASRQDSAPRGSMMMIAQLNDAR